MSIVRIAAQIRQNCLMQTIVAIVFVLLLAASYPDLDWREVRSDKGGFSVLLPSKPRIETQSLPSPKFPMQLHQWSSKARKTAFAIGYADLPQTGSDAVTEMRDVLIRNISGKVISDMPLEINGMPGKDVVAAGRIGDTAVVLRLRSFTGKGRIYQLAVLGPAEDFQPSEIETFFLSFKAYRTNP